MHIHIQDTSASLCFRGQQIFLHNAHGKFGAVPLEASGDFGIHPDKGEFHVMCQVFTFLFFLLNECIVEQELQKDFSYLYKSFICVMEFFLMQYWTGQFLLFFCL